MKNYDITFPRLVSYPRTGSHWLRMVLEKYLNKYCSPSLFFGTTEPWGYHLHDRIVGEGIEGATRDFDKVIYLYRNPVDTIFSNLNYHKLNTTKIKNVDNFINEYLNHLNRWMHNNEDIKNIIFITYEDIKLNHEQVFKAVVEFLGYKFNASKIQQIYDTITIQSVKETTVQLGLMDSSAPIINNDHFTGSYKNLKKDFIATFGQYIDDKFNNVWV